MSLRFELAYLFGYTPWDRWGGKPLGRLRKFFEGPEAPRPGRALDLGCGMGHASIYLAQQGWKVTGIDVVERALRAARRRASKQGVDVEFVHGDISRLAQAGVTGSFDLFVDLGCFHILPDRERQLYCDSILQVAAPNALLILFALGPNQHFLGPRGATRNDIERALSHGWSIESEWVEAELPYRLPKGATATWYRLRRVLAGKEQRTL